MAPQTNRQLIERYARALSQNDLDAQDALLHDDYVGFLPQSRERIIGRANRRSMIESYPGGESGLPVSVERIVGSEDQWVATPSWTLAHIIGSGDEYVLAGQIRYPDGKDWHIISLLTLRDHKIWRETTYFGAPFEAPAWRSAYIERES